jgi:uncharacterized protein
LDEFVSDIKYIHYDIGLDMTKFNIMFAFDSLKNSEKFTPKIPGTQMLNHEEQVIFYQKLMKEFKGTDLNDGLRNHWFKEFTPEFCCSAINCGDKFFLLQANGDVYACPRGQSSPHFYYGNVKKSRISDIIANGWQTIEALENKKEPCEDCYTCHYLPYCNQGCIFVREETGLTKSYTCLLQKQIYQDNPERYPPYDEKYVEEYSLRYRFRNNLKSIKKSEHQPTNDRYITPELWDEDNALAQLIKKDPILQKVYDPELFQLIIDDIPYQLKSPILENQSDIALIKPSSQVYLTVDKDVFSLNTKDPVNNTVHLMFLRNTMVTYGDENRLKQEHLVDYSIYEGAFRSFAKVENSDKTMVASKVLYFDLGPFLRLHQDLFLQDIRNNLYVTTKTLREYHYSKQRKNAFYHIQSINLPFPFLEFYW